MAFLLVFLTLFYLINKSDSNLENDIKLAGIPTPLETMGLYIDALKYSSEFVPAGNGIFKELLYFPLSLSVPPPG